MYIKQEVKNYKLYSNITKTKMKNLLERKWDS